MADLPPPDPDYDDDDDFVSDDDDEDVFEKLDTKELQDIAGSPPKTPFKQQNEIQPTNPLTFTDNFWRQNTNFYQVKSADLVLKGIVKDGTKIISFPHPAKSGKPARWIINDKSELLEIQKCTANASWFVNNRVIEDGSLYITSPVDPLFLLLPRLEKLRKADQIWMNDDVDWKLIKACLQANGSTLSVICDTKKESGELYYKLNDNKVFEWLQRKVDSICEYLEKMPDVVALVKAQAAGVRLRKDETVTSGQLITAAINFLKEYLPPRWSGRLRDFYGPLLTQPKETVVYMTEDIDAINQKKRKLEAQEAGSEPSTPAKKRRKLSEIQLEKVDKTNIPKLTTFFKKIQ